MATFPSKVNYATGDVLTATNMNDVGGALNLLESAQYAAGKNKIINGDFNINQRAFTSATTSGTFGFDRWNMQTVDGTTTYSAQTFTPGTAPVAGYESTNFARLVSTGQTLTTAQSRLNQKIEDVRTFAGQTVVVSFWAKASTGTPSVAMNLSQNFGSGGSASVTVTGQKTAITTSWVRYSKTFAVPSISGKTIGTGSHVNFNVWTSAGSDQNTATDSLGIQSVTIDFWGVQVEAASNASPFQTASGSIAGELALCQRYYQRVNAGIGSHFNLGQAYSITNALGIMPFPVQMRIAPSALEQSGTAANYGLSTLNLTFNACTSVPVFNNATVNQINFVFVSTGIVAGNATHFVSKDNNAYLGWSAEL